MNTIAGFRTRAKSDWLWSIGIWYDILNSVSISTFCYRVLTRCCDCTKVFVIRDMKTDTRSRIVTNFQGQFSRIVCVKENTDILHITTLSWITLKSMTKTTCSYLCRIVLTFRTVLAEKLKICFSIIQLEYIVTDKWKFRTWFVFMAISIFFVNPLFATT